MFLSVPQVEIYEIIKYDISISPWPWPLTLKMFISLKSPWQQTCKELDYMFLSIPEDEIFQFIKFQVSFSAGPPGPTRAQTGDTKTRINSFHDFITSRAMIMISKSISFYYPKCFYINCDNLVVSGMTKYVVYLLPTIVYMYTFGIITRLFRVLFFIDSPCRPKVWLNILKFEQGACLSTVVTLLRQTTRGFCQWFVNVLGHHEVSQPRFIHHFHAMLTVWGAWC
jgi:hypothetical protein